jgi:UDP-3-O-[3-hydroxymyristoyl] glucosamine N-acyltransferase
MVQEESARRAGEEVMKLGEIASRVGGVLAGDADADITGIAGIKEARSGDVTFLLNKSFEKYLAASEATAVIAGKDVDRDLFQGKSAVFVENPALAYAEVAGLFEEVQDIPKGVSSGACVLEDAVVSADASILPYVYVGSGAVIEENAVVHPFCYIGRDVRIGAGTVIYPNVSIYGGTRVGKRVTIHAGAVLGADGFAYAWDGKRHRKIPQLGSLEIGDDVEIGANTCIDRGSLGKTIIERGTKIDNLVQIAHNVSIGEHSIVVSQVGIAGSTAVGKNVVLGGKVGVRDHVAIGDNVMAAGGTGITKDVKAGSVIAGTPHLPHREWLRLQGCLKRLPELFERINKIEDAIRRG